MSDVLQEMLFKLIQKGKWEPADSRSYAGGIRQGCSWGGGCTSIFEELKIVHCLEHECVCTCLSTYVHGGMGNCAGKL